MLVQFAKGVDWGKLDYLIIDLPPGTGDVQLSLSQIAPLAGAIVVSTPQDVALRVAQKAIAMFKKVRCPVLGIVENMSQYVCPKCGHEENIFGSGGARQASEKFGIPFLGAIALNKKIRTASDEGKPIVLADPKSDLAKAFTGVADRMIIELQNLQGRNGSASEIKITY